MTERRLGKTIPKSQSHITSKWALMDDWSSLYNFCNIRSRMRFEVRMSPSCEFIPGIIELINLKIFFLFPTPSRWHGVISNFKDLQNLFLKDIYSKSWKVMLIGIILALPIQFRNRWRLLLVVFWWKYIEMLGFLLAHIYNFVPILSHFFEYRELVKLFAKFNLF